MNHYLLILFVLLFGAPAFADEETPEFITQTNAEAVITDPFTYQRGTLGEGDYVPTSDFSIPTGIRVLAIIEVEGHPSYAALKIPALPDTVFAKGGDAIRLDHQNSTPGKTTSPVPIYLLVQKVSRNGVEISPRERPSDIHIFQ